MSDIDRQTHPKKADVRVPVDLSADGVLFMINVQVFHPRGYALCLDTDGTFQLFGDGTERWVFSETDEESADNDAKWAAFNELLQRAKA